MLNLVMRCLEEERGPDYSENMAENSVKHVQNFGRCYISAILFLKEVKKPTVEEALKLAISFFEEKYNVKVNCGKEAVDWKDILINAVEDPIRHVPTGKETVVEEHRKNPESRYLGEIINRLERELPEGGENITVLGGTEGYPRYRPDEGVSRRPRDSRKPRTPRRLYPLPF